MSLKIKAGDRYKRLTIISETEPHITSSGISRRKMLCQCDCGNIKAVKLIDLCRGHAHSCGCLRRENHPDTTTHSFSNSSLYFVWDSIKQRCFNRNRKDYKNYGGRGITICEEWANDFMSFYNWAMANGYERGLEIDRINNDGNYEPSNCRYVTRQTNSQNTRSTVLDIKKVKAIVELREKTNWGHIKIGRALNLSSSAVHGVIHQNTWNSNK